MIIIGVSRHYTSGMQSSMVASKDPPTGELQIPVVAAAATASHRRRGVTLWILLTLLAYFPACCTSQGVGFRPGGPTVPRSPAYFQPFSPAPVPVATAAPITQIPTFRPIGQPTSSPTPVPTNPPTEEPPTPEPTVPPTFSSSTRTPTLPPTQPSLFPPGGVTRNTTASPTQATIADVPTTTPTATIATSTTGTEERSRITGITIDFVGVDELTPAEIVDFEWITEEWYEAYYSGLDLTTTVSVIDQTIVRRTTTTDTATTINTIQYDQTLVYKALDNSLNAREYAVGPFLNVQARNDYASRLQQSDAFRNVQIPIPTPNIPPIEEADNPQDGIGAESSEGTGLATGSLVGIIAGLLAAVAVAVFATIWAVSRNRKRQQGQSPPSVAGRAPTTPSSGQTVVAVTVQQEPDNAAAAAARLPTFKDQTQSARQREEDHEQQNPSTPPVPFAAAIMIPAQNSNNTPSGGGLVLPTFKDQTQSVNRTRGQQQQHVPLANDDVLHLITSNDLYQQQQSGRAGIDS